MIFYYVIRLAALLLMQVIHPIDAGIIRCICGFDHDDGFTLQCEKCNVWQHAHCVGFSDESSVPDIFYCDQCGSRELDPVKAKEYQVKYLKKMERIQNDSPSGPGRKRGRKRKAPPPSDPEFTDRPGCFFVKINENTLSKDAKTIAASLGLPRIPVPEISSELSVSRISNRGAFQIAAFGLFSDWKNAGDLVCEVVGEIITQDAYKHNPVNQYRLVGAPKPGVIFIAHTPLAVDCRRVGNNGAFIGHSASPNLEARAVYDDNDRLRILCYALQPVNQHTQLTVDWSWHPSHPIRKVASNETLGNDEEAYLNNSIRRLRELGCTGPLTSFYPSKAPLTRYPVFDRMKQLKKDFKVRPPQQPQPTNGPIAPNAVWAVPSAGPKSSEEATTPATKKRLSLADYMKKKPVLSK